MKKDKIVDEQTHLPKCKECGAVLIGIYEVDAGICLIEHRGEDDGFDEVFDDLIAHILNKGN